MVHMSRTSVNCVFTWENHVSEGRNKEPSNYVAPNPLDHWLTPTNVVSHYASQYVTGVIVLVNPPPTRKQLLLAIISYVLSLYLLLHSIPLLVSQWSVASGWSNRTLVKKCALCCCNIAAVLLMVNCIAETSLTRSVGAEMQWVNVTQEFYQDQYHKQLIKTKIAIHRLYCNYCVSVHYPSS